MILLFPWADKKSNNDPNMRMAVYCANIEVAVADAFDGIPLDYAMLTKLYKEPPMEGQEKRYSPGVCCEIRKDEIKGDPDPKHISTSYVERMNLQIRMGMRRFTRLTNSHSKKIENHRHALSIYFMYYNFARIHQTLRVTPAKEAGVTNHVWSIEEIVALIDQDEIDVFGPIARIAIPLVGVARIIT